MLREELFLHLRTGQVLAPKEGSLNQDIFVPVRQETVQYRSRS